MTGRSRAKGPPAEPSYIVPALARGLRLLQAFSTDEAVQSLGRLAKELGLPRATTFRLAGTLMHLGFLKRDEETGEYRIGVAALKLGWNYLSRLELPEIAHPFLKRLRDRTGASAHLAVRDVRDIVYVSRLPANTALSSNIRVGSRLPAHATSMGRALLSDIEEDEFYALYAGVDELETFSEETPRTVAQLRKLSIKDAANDGMIISHGYYEKGVVSIAAPVRDGGNRAVAAINITAPTDKYPDETLEGEVFAHVLDAARDISMALGHDPDSRKGVVRHQIALPGTVLADPQPAIDAEIPEARGTGRLKLSTRRAR